MRTGQPRAHHADSCLEFRDQHGRALTPERRSTLITTTWDGPVRFGMTGPERSMLYRLAGETELSVEELRTLTPASFRLGDSPTVTVSVGRRRSRCRAKVLSLRSETAVDLGSFLIVPEPTQPVFRIPDKFAEMIREDIRAADLAEGRGANGAVIDADRASSDKQPWAEHQ